MRRQMRQGSGRRREVADAADAMAGRCGTRRWRGLTTTMGPICRFTPSRWRDSYPFGSYLIPFDPLKLESPAEVID